MLSFDGDERVSAGVDECDCCWRCDAGDGKDTTTLGQSRGFIHFSKHLDLYRVLRSSDHVLNDASCSNPLTSSTRSSIASSRQKEP